MQQEELVRRRLHLSETISDIQDGAVDHIENRINAIVVSDSIVPRYPFFVLCILQTYERYMPDNLSITSYGHCYHALIVAMLIKAGVQETDSDVNACFNFAEHLAFEVYLKRKKGQAIDASEFRTFLTKYKEDYILKESMLNRLRHKEYGIFSKTGEFKHMYIYYFFLGRFFARRAAQYERILQEICDEGHLRDNHVILLFIVHHTNDDSIIEEIVLRTMCALEDFEPAKLDEDETKRFQNILTSIPKNILSDKSVKDERESERRIRDKHDSRKDADSDGEGKERLVGEMYRVLKGHKILAQILRNRYGNLQREKVEELVETIVEGGLRVVNSVLADEEEIRKLAVCIRERNPKYRLKRIENALRALSLIWTMGNIERVVEAVNVPEIKDTVRKIVAEKNTPAYDIVGYFAALDSAKELNDDVRALLGSLLRKRKGLFVKSVVSLRTQQYMNTHRNKAAIEQAVCSLLQIPYKHRPGHI